MTEISNLETPTLSESVPQNTHQVSEETDTPSLAQHEVAQTATENALVTTTDGGEVTQKKTKKIIRRKKRPARPQVDPSTIKSEPPPQTGTIFNIWYVSPVVTMSAMTLGQIVR